MTTRYPGGGSSPTRAQQISGPAELLQAVPYLLGFHPRRSLVLVGLSRGTLVVTARLDLDDAVVPELLWSSLRGMCGGGTTEVIAAVYADDAGDADASEAVADRSGGSDGSMPWWQLCNEVENAVDELACRLVDVLLVTGRRWWSLSCTEVDCCPPEGNVLPDAPSAFATAATVEGVVPLPDRESLAGLLTPLPDPAREALDPALAAAENAACAAVLAGGADRHERSVKRAMFAVARASAAARWTPPDDATVARFAAALLEPSLRDAMWLAVDDRRLDGRALWRELARRVPPPYDAAPLFLYGWATWRRGNSALAGIAAELALVSDPKYSAADLLLAALTQHVDPRRMPRLRRSA